MIQTDGVDSDLPSRTSIPERYVKIIYLYSSLIQLRPDPFSWASPSRFAAFGRLFRADREITISKKKKVGGHRPCLPHHDRLPPGWEPKRGASTYPSFASDVSASDPVLLVTCPSESTIFSDRSPRTQSDSRSSNAIPFHRETQHAEEPCVDIRVKEPLCYRFGQTCRTLSMIQFLTGPTDFVTVRFNRFSQFFHRRRKNVNLRLKSLTRPGPHAISGLNQNP